MYLKRLKHKEATKLVFENEDEFVEFQRSINDAIPVTNEFAKGCADRWLTGIDNGYQASDPTEGGRPSATIHNSAIADMIPLTCSLANVSSAKASVDRTKYVPSEKYNELMQKYAELETELQGSVNSMEQQKKDFEIQNLKKEKEGLMSENVSVNNRYMTTLGNLSALLIKNSVVDPDKLNGYNEVLSGTSQSFSSVSYKKATQALEKSIIQAITGLIAKESQNRTARLNAEKHAADVEKKNSDLARISDALIAKQNKFNEEVDNVEPLLKTIKDSASALYAIFIADGTIDWGKQVPAEEKPAEVVDDSPKSETQETDDEEDFFDYDDILPF